MRAALRCGVVAARLVAASEGRSWLQSGGSRHRVVVAARGLSGSCVWALECRLTNCGAQA